MRLVRIHDRQLAALQLVALVRIDLVHHRRPADSRARPAGPAGDRSGSACRRGRARRRRRRRSPPRRCTSCRSWSCPAAGRGTCGRRRRAPSPCRVSILRSVSGSSFGSHGPTALPSSSSTRTRWVVSGCVSAAGDRRVRARRAARGGDLDPREVGRVAGPERGSGTCSASLGALRRTGSLSLIARPLSALAREGQVSLSRRLDFGSFGRNRRISPWRLQIFDPNLTQAPTSSWPFLRGGRTRNCHAAWRTALARCEPAG